MLFVRLPGLLVAAISGSGVFSMDFATAQPSSLYRLWHGLLGLQAVDVFGQRKDAGADIGFGIRMGPLAYKILRPRAR